jgi:outer membrane protein TolC
MRVKMKKLNNVPLCAGVLGATMLLSSVLAIAASQDTLKVTALEAQKIEEAQAQLQTLIKQELQAGKGLLAGRKLLQLSNKKAVMMALENNLSVKRGHLNKQIASLALIEAKAVFDPVLLVSLAIDRTQINDRTESGERFQSETEEKDNKNVLEINEAQDPRAPVIVFTESREEGFKEGNIVASQAPLSGADVQLSMGAGVVQLLPWGGSININYTAINKDSSFVNNGGLFFGNPNPPLKLISHGSYKRPWSSQLSAAFNTPLPGTRNFSHNSPLVLNKNKQTLTKEAAIVEVKNVINQTLLQVDNTYWGVVESALALQAVLESVRTSKLQLTSAKRLHKNRSANNYDLAQAELSLERNKANEELAWLAYITASDRLSVLLAMPLNSLIVPEGFAKRISNYQNDKQSINGTTDQHPAYLSGVIGESVSMLERDAAVQGQNVDLTFELEFSLKQSNQVFGYKSFADSLGAVFDPDISSQKVGLSYVYPIGNQGLKAQGRSSEAAYQQSTLNVLATKNTLNSRLKAAQAVLIGSNTSLKFLAEAFSLASLSYTKAIKQQRNRQVKEYELSGLHVQLLNARLAYISGLIAVQRAESSVLAAQGVLNEKYAKRLSASPFEARRLSLLQGQRNFEFFLLQGEIR